MTLRRRRGTKKGINMPHMTEDVGASGSAVVMVRGVVGAAGAALLVVEVEMEGDVVVVKLFQFLKHKAKRKMINVGEGGAGVTGDPETSATWTPRSGSRGTRPGRPPRTTAASRQRRRRSSGRRQEE